MLDRVAIGARFTRPGPLTFALASSWKLESPPSQHSANTALRFAYSSLSSSSKFQQSPPMSIFEYNGSAVVAMVGKNCFAIASDRRLGVQLQTIATDFQKIYKVHDKLFIGLSGLATDAQTLYQRLVFRHKLYELREERNMKPETFASLVSALLYEKRFGPYFCQPVIAGLGDENKPFICTMDSIGAKELAKDFVVSGTASESLYGACEAMFKPDMEPEELFETISQALLSSVDRDCLSGWGGHVYVVTPTEVTERILKGRMD
ncbi:proteasome subunit beta type-3-A-like [Rhododendron vialii]|uniref:proteasome subunit beta type-3-A-like n=1 Tax=Rhododendron vialii TaxID=182163 RepID=UPI00265EB911|nr:proteasome subunit beta type-3-A-like [Rhododendron vialii]